IAPQARKKEIGNANRKLLVGHYHARRARVSRRDFLQKKFGFYPRHTANFENLKFRGNYRRSKAPQTAREARQALNLQQFATLRAAKRKCFGFGFESSFGQSPKQNEVL
ncbi:hypothetical protein KKH38_00660, partial [Patescibacteria group bacterium]|nr:hypothetical protein [Patescibacteria group bacterium]MCG2697988.1 hypothetical protein [Candidatus Parcubacteria bacterium]